MNEKDEIADFDGFVDLDDFSNITDVLEALVSHGSEWEDLLDVCLLASAYCAQNADMSAMDYMKIISSVRLTSDGIYGEA